MSDLVGNLLLIGLAVTGATFLGLVAWQTRQSRKRTQNTLARMKRLAPRVDLEEAMRRVDAIERGEARDHLPATPIFSRRPARPA